jgi:outer membrane protein OmpA-like peptidoglycan-associated protein
MKVILIATVKRNEPKAEDRASAVKAIIEKGKGDNLTTIGGETKPIDTNKTAAGKAHNRRAEFL